MATTDTLSERIRKCNSTVADDRLADAAQDLYAACKELVVDLIAHARFGLNESEVSMLRRAEATIAKADGRDGAK